MSTQGKCPVVHGGNTATGSPPMAWWQYRHWQSTDGMVAQLIDQRLKE
jgi:hypothetical protein